MNTRKTTSLIAIGALLPLAAWGQSSDSQSRDNMSEKPGASARDTHTPSGAGAIEKRPGHNSPHYTPDNNERRNANTGGASTQGQSHSATGAGVSGSLAAGQIQRVSSEQLDQRVTAASLMGKKVVDREGQEIGKVKDIGLASVAPQLAMRGDARGGAASGSTTYSTRQGLGGRQQTTGTTEGSPGLQSAAGDVDTRQRQSDPYLRDQRIQREVDRAGTAGSDTGMAASSDGAQRTRDQQQQWTRNQTGQQDMSGGETRIFVQPDRSLGASGDLVAIPASQIQRQGDQLRVNMSRDELRSLLQQSARVTMNE